MSTGSLSGCGLSNADSITTIASNEDGVTVVPSSGRNNCGGRCVINVHVKDGNVLKISTDESEDTVENPQLRACVRGRGYRKAFLHPDRLKYPMKRVGKRGEGKFEQISWEEAIDIIVSENNRIRDTYGPGSRYVNYGSGVNNLLRGDQWARRLLALDGGVLTFYGTYSSGQTS